MPDIVRSDVVPESSGRGSEVSEIPYRPGRVFKASQDTVSEGSLYESEDDDDSDLDEVERSRNRRITFGELSAITCRNCQNKHAKCDRQRPACGNCRRRKQRCRYGGLGGRIVANHPQITPLHPSNGLTGHPDDSSSLNTFQQPVLSTKSNAESETSHWQKKRKADDADYARQKKVALPNVTGITKGLPLALRSPVGNYLREHPTKVPEFASSSQPRRLTGRSPEETAMWISKDNVPLEVKPYSLAKYGWIDVASEKGIFYQDSNFPIRIIKWFPCKGHNTSFGGSAWFAWNENSGFEKTPSVFKYQGQGNLMPVKHSQLPNDSREPVDIAPGPGTTSRQISNQLTRQSSETQRSSEQGPEVRSSQPRNSFESRSTRQSLSDGRFRPKNIAHSRSNQGSNADLLNGSDSWTCRDVILNFRGTRPRSRAFSECANTEDLLAQIQAAGVFDMKSGIKVLLFKPSAGRERAIVRKSGGGLAEQDFQELEKAIRTEKAKSIDVTLCYTEWPTSDRDRYLGQLERIESEAQNAVHTP